MTETPFAAGVKCSEKLDKIPQGLYTIVEQRIF